MPHAALLVVQGTSIIVAITYIICFNAARGFVGGARGWIVTELHSCLVSMPHAALLVVQACTRSSHPKTRRFNAARGFVGGARIVHSFPPSHSRCFNAARGFVGGARIY